MKIKTIITLLAIMLTFSAAYASFPVKRVTKTDSNTEVKVETEEVVALTTSSQSQDKWVGVALWFFLGWPFAAHRWYYKKPVGANILFILTIGGLGIWAIVDLINILTDNF